MSVFAATPLFLVVVLAALSFCIGWACGRGIGYSAGYAEGYEQAESEARRRRLGQDLVFQAALREELYKIGEG